MGSGNSHHQTASNYMDPPMMMHESPAPAPYPDMNMIFKSIPKMMQVADDMHRMSNYIMDLRNMMFACSVLSAVGIIMFLLMKHLQGRKSGSTSARRRRQRQSHNNNNHRSDESEQSSLSLGRPVAGAGGGGCGSTSGYRHYHAARPVDGWAAHAALAGADSAPRLMVDSTSTRHTHIGTPQHGGAVAAPLLVSAYNMWHSVAGMNTTPTKGYAAGSPEHHHAYHQQQQQLLQHHHQQQQYANALRDSSPHLATTSPTTTASAGHSAGGGATAGGHTTTVPPSASASNGQLKRFEPVKLVVDEMPYADNDQHQQQQQQHEEDE